MQTTYRAGFLFAGMGGGAYGFQSARATLAGLGGRFEIACAVDVDAPAAADFETLTGVPCTVADLETMEASELRACSTGPLDILFTSPPCKGFSGCLPKSKAKLEKYQRLNRLTVRGLRLALTAWPEALPRLIILENVPRIRQRGVELLTEIKALFEEHGYAWRETVHDCGEIGGLAQHRNRYLLVARLQQGPRAALDWWREPDKLRVRGVGEELSKLPIPLPRSKAGGFHHRLPELSDLNIARLALIPAGRDWRALPPEVVLAECAEAVGLPPRDSRQNGGYGVEDWNAAARAVLGEGTVRNTPVSVAEPRLTDADGRFHGGHRVGAWDAAAGTVIGAAAASRGANVADKRVRRVRRASAKLGQMVFDLRPDDAVTPDDASPDAGAPAEVSAAEVSRDVTGHEDPRPGYPSRNGHHVQDWNAAGKTVIGQDPRGLKGAAVAEPRLSERSTRHANKYAVTPWSAAGPTVLGKGFDNIGAGAPSVGDVRLSDNPNRHSSKYAMTGWDESAGTVTGADRVGSGAPSVGDVRLAKAKPRSGMLGVTPWQDPAGVVVGAGDVHNSAVSVEDIRSQCQRREGAIGVTPWTEPIAAVIGNATIANHPCQVADERGAGFEVAHVVKLDDGRLAIVGAKLDFKMKRARKTPPVVILSLDGTWHRPMTTLELAALQGFPTQMPDGAWLRLFGKSDGKARERIGNAVPPPAARSIATTALGCLLSSDSNQITLSSNPIWVGPEELAACDDDGSTSVAWGLDVGAGGATVFEPTMEATA